MRSNPFIGTLAILSGAASVIITLLGGCMFLLVGMAPQQCAVAGATCALLIAAYTVPRMWIVAHEAFTGDDGMEEPDSATAAASRSPHTARSRATS